MIDMLLVSISRDRYNEILHDAAQERRARQVEAATHAADAPLLARVGDTLIAAGQKLKTRYQVSSASPA
jgi:hypothetical protein